MEKRINKAIFTAPNAAVTGRVELAEETSVWYGASLRGDLAPVSIGKGTNIQDNATVHVDTDTPTSIGSGVTVGHNAIIHGCTVGDDCLIGMGAIVLNRAEIGKESIVGAGALVTEGKSFPSRSLIIGSPAKAIRTVTDEELEKIRANAVRYVESARKHAAGEV